MLTAVGILGVYDQLREPEAGRSLHMPIASPWCSGASDGWGLLPERGLNVEMNHGPTVEVDAGLVRLQHLGVSSINFKRQKDKIDFWTLIILSVDISILSLSNNIRFLQFYQLDKRAIFLHS